MRRTSQQPASADNRRLNSGSSRQKLASWGVFGMLLICAAANSRSDLPAAPRPGAFQSEPLSAEHEGEWTGRCENCHVTDTGFSHPVEVSPSMQIPAELPLVDGRVTCITCHDNNSASAHSQARLDGSALLRQPLTEGGLCSQCHNPLSPLQRDQHANMLQQAHLWWPDRATAGIESGSGGRGRLFDPDSETCLGCHDGSVAKGVGHDRTGFVVSGSYRSIGFPDSHPVGVEYPQNSALRRGTPLKPSDMLDDRIRLYDHRVGCGTCHSPYSPREDLLVMSNARSALCLNCHDL